MSQRMIEISLFLGALLLAVLATHAYLVSRTEEQKLQSTLTSQNQIISDAATRQKQRDTALAATLADIAKQKADKQSPQELADALAKVLALPEPIHLVPNAVPNVVGKPLSLSAPAGRPSRGTLSALTSVTKRLKSATPAKSSAALQLDNPDPQQPKHVPPAAGSDSFHPPALSHGLAATQSTLPEPPCPKSSKCPQAPDPAELPVELPVDDLKPLYNFALDCRACQAQLAVAKQNATDDAAKIAALTRERGRRNRR